MVCQASSEDNFANLAAPATTCFIENQHDFIDMAHGASSKNYLADVVAMAACHNHNQHDFIDKVCQCIK